MRNTIAKIANYRKTLIHAFLVAIAGLFSSCQPNTVYFATNTQFGIRAGVDSKQIPEVEIGYNRQEGVMMPYYIDTGTNSPVSHKQKNELEAKLATDTSHIGASQSTVEERKFIGENNQGNHKDSYSVIAIFHGNGGGNASAGTSNSVGAKMGVAQYFATGVAAQLLAEHGASVVGGPPSGSDSPALIISNLQHQANIDLTAITAYVTKPDKSLDTDRLAAIAGTNAPPFPPNDVLSFIHPGSGVSAPNLDDFKKRVSSGGAWAPYVFTWYSAYTNITGIANP